MFNPSTQQVEPDRSLSSRSTWSKKLVLVQLGLQRETVLKTYKETKFLQTTTKEDISIKYTSAIVFLIYCVCACVCMISVHLWCVYVITAYEWIQENIYRRQSRVSDASCYHSPHLSLESGSLAEPRARMTPCKPQHSHCFCFPAVMGYGHKNNHSLHFMWMEKIQTQVSELVQQASLPTEPDLRSPKLWFLYSY